MLRCGLTVLLVFCAVVLAVCPRAAVAAEEKEKPNFLFIFADDQSFETIRSSGNHEIETPNLDRLAKRGVSFTHAYNMGSWSGAVCVASRCMLNTGRFLWDANDVYRSCEKEREAGRFWSEHLKKAGYETYMTGKWHNPAKPENAFDNTQYVRGGMPRADKLSYNRPVKGEPNGWTPWDKKFGGFWAGGKHWSEVVGDVGTEYIEKAAKSEKPFFMYLAFNAPHDPRQSPKEFVDRYPIDKVALPKNYLTVYPEADAIGCGWTLRDARTAPLPRTEYAVKVNRQEYYAIVTHMDQQVGRILDALEKSGKADNTYIFFSADHGLACGHHGLMGKQNMYDHSVRVPLMVVGPDVPKDKKLDGDVYLQDIMATTLDLAAVEKPDYVKFQSLMPMVRGEKKSNYDAIYGAYLKLQRMVRADGYKLILYPAAKKVKLFNLKDDPEEMKNLADDPKMKPIGKKLFARFLKLQQETGDSLDVKAVFPQLQ